MQQYNKKSGKIKPTYKGVIPPQHTSQVTIRRFLTLETYLCDPEVMTHLNYHSHTLFYLHILIRLMTEYGLVNITR